MNENNRAKKTAIEYYVRDTFLLLKEEAIASKAQHDSAVNTPDYQYRLGYLSALSDVISLLQSQASAFDIHLSEIGLDDIEPERELL